MDPLNLVFILPELGLTLLAFAVLLLGVFQKVKTHVAGLCLIGIIATAFFLPTSFEAGSHFFSGMLANDGISRIFRQLIVLMVGFIILLSMGYKELTDEDKTEYYFFLLVMAVSMMLAVSSNNLMMVYITLETISILSYIMAGFLKRDMFSSEAGVKYFLFGALSTGITLYGISLVYGLFGTLDLGNILMMLMNPSGNMIALSVAVILVLAGFAFKCSLVPFHMWTPDVYQGAPTPVAALFSLAPKAVGFAFLMRIFALGFGPFVTHWGMLAACIAGLTMTIGNLMALKQDNMKRLLAYSTIAQAGYIFVGICVGTEGGLLAVLFYLVVYTIMNVGAFAAVIAFFNSVKSENIQDYAGMYKKDPLNAIVLAVSLLSLAGIPPLAGFMAKFFILAAAIEAKHILLAVVMVINSVIALYYYVRVIKVMFLDEPKNPAVVAQAMPLQWAMIIVLIANLLIGIFPQDLMSWFLRFLS